MIERLLPNKMGFSADTITCMNYPLSICDTRNNKPGTTFSTLLRPFSRSGELLGFPATSCFPVRRRKGAGCLERALGEQQLEDRDFDAGGFFLG
jgi:hypothetical protein